MSEEKKVVVIDIGHAVHEERADTISTSEDHRFVFIGETRYAKADFDRMVKEYHRLVGVDDD